MQIKKQFQVNQISNWRKKSKKNVKKSKKKVK